MANKHIVLITTGQPSTNPRLVKEADTLVAKGYQVTVLYAYWNSWATETDRQMLTHRRWAAFRVGGNPLTDKRLFIQSKVYHTLCRRLFKYFTYLGTFGINLSFRIQEYAIARATPALIRASKQLKADLYIAHNLGALPAAVYAAQINHGLAGFDAEDYHRNEGTNNQRSVSYLLNKALEDRFIPLLQYFSVSSPMIKALYEQHYQMPALLIRNMFPKFQKLKANGDRKRLRLCWFSQTIGPNRGLELLIRALQNLDPEKIELHLLGNLKIGFKAQMSQLNEQNLQSLRIVFHEPVSPAKLCDFIADFDIGIASEPAFCINNDVALSNKVYTYIQCGLALLLSDTSAQKAFHQEYPGIGMLYKKDSIKDLKAAILYYLKHPEYLQTVKESNYRLGQYKLNWEKEADKFVNQIGYTLQGNALNEKCPVVKHHINAVAEIALTKPSLIGRSQFNTVEEPFKREESNIKAISHRHGDLLSRKPDQDHGE